MSLNNQAKVGLVAVICLIFQGYVFAYILDINPNVIISFIPLIPYLVYIYARGSRRWYYNRPIYWIALVIALTLIDILLCSLGIISGLGLK
jgi:ABC-type iron transport system FetAB permease component